MVRQFQLERQVDDQCLVWEFRMQFVSPVVASFIKHGCFIGVEHIYYSTYRIRIVNSTEADVNKAGSAAQNPSSWTGWAVTSLTSRLYRGGGTKPAASGTGGPQQGKYY